MRLGWGVWCETWAAVPGSVGQRARSAPPASRGTSSRARSAAPSHAGLHDSPIRVSAQVCSHTAVLLQQGAGILEHLTTGSMPAQELELVVA